MLLMSFGNVFHSIYVLVRAPSSWWRRLECIMGKWMCCIGMQGSGVQDTSLWDRNCEESPSFFADWLPVYPTALSLLLLMILKNRKNLYHIFINLSGISLEKLYSALSIFFQVIKGSDLLKLTVTLLLNCIFFSLPFKSSIASLLKAIKFLITISAVLIKLKLIIYKSCQLLPNVWFQPIPAFLGFVVGSIHSW